jgi:hypothetical protein
MARKPHPNQLSLFSGPHTTENPFRQALDHDDLEAAVRVAPAIWRGATSALQHAVQAASPEARVAALAAVSHDLPELLKPVWYRLVAQSLDKHSPVGIHDGQSAGWFWLLGERPDLARKSLQRHLSVRPLDVEAWALLAKFEPERASARCAFHGGPVLAEAAEMVKEVEADDLPAGPWLLPYAWLLGKLSDADLRDALQAEDLHRRTPLAIPRDAKAFAAYMDVAREQRRRGHVAPGEIDARRAMQQIHEPAFQRWLLRVTA